MYRPKLTLYLFKSCITMYIGGTRGISPVSILTSITVNYYSLEP